MRPSVSWRRIFSPPASVSHSCSSSSPSPAGGSSFCNAATRRRSVRFAAASCSWSRRRLSPAQRASCSHGRCARAGPADSDAHDRHRSLRTRREDRGRLLGGPRAQHEQRRRPPLATSPSRSLPMPPSSRSTTTRSSGMGLPGRALRRIGGHGGLYAAADISHFAAWVHETDRGMREELTRRGYAVDTTTRAMGMSLDDVSSPAARDRARTSRLARAPAPHRRLVGSPAGPRPCSPASPRRPTRG